MTANSPVQFSLPALTGLKLSELISALSHALDITEGQPEGQHERHWSEATSQIEAEERIGATDNLEDTELTSALAVEGDPVEDAFLDKGDAETEPDLGGRVKDPI